MANSVYKCGLCYASVDGETRRSASLMLENHPTPWRFTDSVCEFCAAAWDAGKIIIYPPEVRIDPNATRYAEAMRALAEKDARGESLAVPNLAQAEAAADAALGGEGAIQGKPAGSFATNADAAKSGAVGSKSRANTAGGRVGLGL